MAAKASALGGALVALAVMAGGAASGVALAADAATQTDETSIEPAADAHRKLIWKRQIGTPKYDSAQGVATDADGNILISGLTEGSLGGTSQGDRDAFVAKYNAAGSRLWTKHLGSGGDDRAQSVAVDSDGNVLIAGETSGALGGTYFGGNDLFLAKYTAGGDLRWVRQIGTADFETGGFVTTDAENNVLVTGLTSGSLGDDNPSHSYQAFVGKYTGDGDLIWAKQLGATTADVGPQAIATDTDRNVLIAGYATGPLAPNRLGGAFVARYGDGEDLRWVRQFEAGESAQASGVAADSEGNVVIAVASKFREFVVKYSAGGDILWTDEVGAGTGSRALTGVTTDGDDNVVVSGYTYGSIGGPNQGDGDAFLIKYDSLGHRLWKRQIGTDRSEWSNGVSTDATGNIVIGGWTDGALAGPNRGLADAFVARSGRSPIRSGALARKAVPSPGTAVVRRPDGPCLAYGLPAEAREGAS